MLAVAVVHFNLLFYDRRDFAMSAPRKIPCGITLTLSNEVVLYCKEKKEKEHCLMSYMVRN